MKKKLLFIPILAALALSTSTASADKAFTLTCGGDPGREVHALGMSVVEVSGQPDIVPIDYHRDCATNATYEVEAQRSTDNGNHWTDMVVQGQKQDFKYSSADGGSVNESVFLHGECVSGDWIRGKTWDADSGNNTTNKFVCP